MTPWIICKCSRRSSPKDALVLEGANSAHEARATPAPTLPRSLAKNPLEYVADQPRYDAEGYLLI
jgi:hypothetical protein